MLKRAQVGCPANIIFAQLSKTSDKTPEALFFVAVPNCMAIAAVAAV